MSLTALSAKLTATKFASGSIAGILAFVISELSTGNLWIAISLSAVSTVAVAFFAHRPRVITARAGAETSAVAEWAALFRQSAEMFESQLARLREKNDRQEKKEALMRVTKHNIGGAYQAAVFHIQGLHELLRSKGITDFPLFTPQTIKELTKVEDEQTLKLFGIEAETR